MAWANADELTVLYSLQATSVAPVPVRLRWVSAPAAARPSRKRIVRSGFVFSARQRVITAHEAAVAVRASDPAIAFRFAGGRFESRWIRRVVSPGQPLELAFSIRFAVNVDPRPAGVTARRARRAISGAVTRTERAYAGLPSLPPRFQRFHPLVLKAAGTLQTLQFVDRDDAGRRRLTVHAGKCGVSSTWFWDSAFSLGALGVAGHAPAAFGAAAALLDGVGPRGEPPVKFRGGKYEMAYQQPILAWGLGLLLEQCPAGAFLERSYAPLCRYVRHWLGDCDADGNGLAEFPARGLAWDDAYRWHTGFPIGFGRKGPWWRKDWGRMQAGDFESVDTNTHLYLECLTLARFARRLGRPADARDWAARARRLARLINTRLFDSRTGLYQDRNIRDGRFTGMVTPANFMPVFAGIAPPDIGRRLCSRYLLDPRHFYTALPFPTLDRSHPAFRSGGFLWSPPQHPGALCNQAYWHGRTWPHVSYWMVGALHRAGLAAEADAAAERILDAMSRSEAIYECYDSLTGQGNGHPEFLWSSAAVLYLAYQRYRGSPVGRV